MSDLPKSLVRFYGNIDFALQPIIYNEITLINADKLNDPFDPNYHVAFDFTPKELEEYLLSQPEFDGKRIECNFEESLPTTREKIDIMCKAAISSTYIFSATSEHESIKPEKNLYLWSHYANGHRGVAIEFNTQILQEAVEKAKYTFMNQSISAILMKIIYAKKLPKLSCKDVGDHLLKRKEGELEARLREMLQYKSDIWKPENEWRLCVNDEATKSPTIRISEIGKQAIKAIYIGLRISEENEKIIEFETKKNFPEAKVYKAKRVDGEFSLDFEQV